VPYLRRRQRTESRALGVKEPRSVRLLAARADPRSFSDGISPVSTVGPRTRRGSTRNESTAVLSASFTEVGRRACAARAVMMVSRDRRQAPMAALAARPGSDSARARRRARLSLLRDGSRRFAARRRSKATVCNDRKRGRSSFSQNAFGDRGVRRCLRPLGYCVSARRLVRCCHTAPPAAPSTITTPINRSEG